VGDGEGARLPHHRLTGLNFAPFKRVTGDFDKAGTENPHQLQRTWEPQHCILTGESVARHTLFRKETRQPGYYCYRGDYPKPDGREWHCFTGSQYDPKTRG